MEQYITSFIKQVVKGKYLILFLIIAVACNKKEENGPYRQINEAIISGIDSLYVIGIGDTLDIDPDISFTLDPVGDTANYKYEWILLNKMGFQYIYNAVLSSEKSINGAINGLDLGIYEVVFRVSDKKTNLFTEKAFRLLVSNEVYEGWLVLSGIDNGSRLDMLSYQTDSQYYKPIYDVLKATGSALSLAGRPNFVNVTYPSIYNKYLGAVFVGTTTGTFVLNTNYMEYSNGETLDAYMPPGTTTAMPDVKFNPSMGFSYLYTSGHIYAGINQLSDISWVQDKSGIAWPFTAAPFIAVDPNYYYMPAVVFNQDEREFLWYAADFSGNATCYPLENGDGKLFTYKTGKDLLYLAHVPYQEGQYVALLKEKDSQAIYLARFTLAEQLYYEEVVGTAIGNAEHIAVSPEDGAVFYNVGSQVYRYDWATKSNQLLTDYGNRQISLLTFSNIRLGLTEARLYSVNYERYEILMRQLVVCTYDPAAMDNSGVFDLYRVAPDNAPFIKQASYTGFGKIVSLTYLER